MPVTLIIGLAMVVYSHRLIKNQVRGVRDRMMDVVSIQAETFQNRLDELVNDAEAIDLLHSSPNSTASGYITNIIKTKPYIDSAVIVFDPDFILEYLDGKHPDYLLENFYSYRPKRGDYGYSPVIYLDDGGNVVTRNERGSWFQYRDWLLLSEHLGHPLWTDPYISIFTNRPVISYVLPLYNKTRLIGSLLLSFTLNSLFFDQNDFGEKVVSSSRITAVKDVLHYLRRVSIFTDNGIETSCSGGNDIPTSQNIYSQIPEEDRKTIWPLMDKVLSGTTGSVRVPHYPLLSRSGQAEDYWFVYSPIRNGTDLILVASFSERMVMAAVYRQIALLTVGGLLVIGLLTLVITTIVLRAFSPVLEITNAARKVASGDLTVRISPKLIRGHSETAILAGTFNSMIQKLQDNIASEVRERTKLEMVEKELKIGQEVQNSLLPKKHSLTNFPLFYLKANIIPANILAGDFFDFWRLDEHRIALTVADVSGKGVPAAMFMVAARTLLRQIAQSDKSPGEVLTEVNQSMQPRNVSNMFVTLFFAYYDTQTGELTYCNAGHNPPAIIRDERKVEWFPYAPNTILGIIPDVHYVTESKALGKRDALILFTDGVTDTESSSGEAFGDKRFCDLLTKLAPKAEDKFLPLLLETLRVFSGKRQKDDITVLFLKRR